MNVLKTLKSKVCDNFAKHVSIHLCNSGEKWTNLTEPYSKIHFKSFKKKYKEEPPSSPQVSV